MSSTTVSRHQVSPENSTEKEGGKKRLEKLNQSSGTIGLEMSLLKQNVTKFDMTPLPHRKTPSHGQEMRLLP